MFNFGELKGKFYIRSETSKQISVELENRLQLRFKIFKFKGFVPFLWHILKTFPKK